MKLWILGANGLLGSALQKKSKYPFIATTKEQADIKDLQSLERFLCLHPEITHIVNCSAFSQVDLAENLKQEAFLVNGKGPENLAFLAKKNGLKLTHISTDYVFDGNLGRPLCEDDITNPLNYYGVTKLEGEQRLLQTFPEGLVIRTSALFGKGGKNFVASLVSLLKSNESLFLANDQYNSPTFADDLSDAILEMCNESGLYHFSNCGSASKYDLGDLMQLCGLRDGWLAKKRNLQAVLSSHFPSACLRPKFTVFNCSKIAKKLTFSIRHWHEAVDEFLKGLYA